MQLHLTYCKVTQNKYKPKSDSMRLVSWYIISYGSFLLLTIIQYIGCGIMNYDNNMCATLNVILIYLFERGVSVYIYNSEKRTERNREGGRVKPSLCPVQYTIIRWGSGTRCYIRCTLFVILLQLLPKHIGVMHTSNTHTHTL